MRSHIRSSVTAGLAMIGISALAIAPIAPMAPPAEPHVPPTVSREVQLTAAPALGAIPLAFIRNQFQYCSLICPFALQGAITVPLAAVATPVAFLGSLVSTGSPLKAIGAAAASVTGPANAAVTPLINNDVFLVVPKAFHALDVAVVEAINVGAAVFTPGQFVDVLQNGRTNVLNALNQPVGTPTTPTGARNIIQVVAVEAINVVTAVAFQAGELLLAGLVQTADAVAQELARSGDPAAALAAGATRAGQVVREASAPVVAAVNNAVTNIGDSLHDPFPAETRTAAPSRAPSNSAGAAASHNDAAASHNDAAASHKRSRVNAEKRQPSTKRPNVGSVHTVDRKPGHKHTLAAESDQFSSADSSTTKARSAVRSSSDSATPSPRKNMTNNGPPR